MSEGCGLLHVAVTEARLGLLRGKEPQALGPEKQQRGGEAKRWELAAREALPNPTSDALPLLSGAGLRCRDVPPCAWLGPPCAWLGPLYAWLGQEIPAELLPCSTTSQGATASASCPGVAPLCLGRRARDGAAREPGPQRWWARGRERNFVETRAAAGGQAIPALAGVL